MPPKPNESAQTIEVLQVRIRELESENTYLRGLLDQAGISYAHNFENVEEATLYDPDQRAHILPVEITHLHAQRFSSAQKPYQCL